MKNQGYLRMVTPLKAARLGLIAIFLLLFGGILVLQTVTKGHDRVLEFFSGNGPPPLEPGSHRSARISMCENEVYTETKYAFVSMLSGNLQLYAISAAKLGASIRRWSPLDMVMIEIKERPLDAEVRSHLQSVGWKICLVPAIPNPPSPKSNPYLDALMYTKLSVWGLVEYDAVAAIDSDMLVVNDPSPLFAHHLPLMRAANRSLAAARDRPLGSCILVSWRSAPFNAGLLLLRPDLAALAALRHAVDHVPHDLESAEQVPLPLLLI